ncbi:MAG: DNA/RNA nuclease SfsA [Synergistaceae bacterium]|jgi:sugar fermentation stimulation protein A|nr:DNA/RNA nuclease SfsA [Synergistaceae bacterium]
MIYNGIRAGFFLARPNRFIAEVEIDGQVEICHVKNTGRCRELLIPGAAVYAERAVNPGRSTKYDLISVRKGRRLVNMDSQAPNRVWMEHLRSGRYLKDIERIRPETKYGDSRFDFYVETRQTRKRKKRKIFMEVKGVTLENDGVALFPDAPTVRGVKHLNELIRSLQEGYEAHVVFVIQMKDVRYFTPSVANHPAFCEALAAAKAAGVRITAMDCDVTENSLTIADRVPVKLPRM